MKSLGGEGPPLGDEPLIERRVQTDRCRRQEFRGTERLWRRWEQRDQEGHRSGSLDTHAGMVSGRALVGAEGEEASQEAKSTVSTFSRNRN